MRRHSLKRQLYQGSKTITIQMCARILFLTFAATVAAAPPAETADLVVTGGRIYSVDASQPWVSAIAIKDKHFIYVGDKAGGKRFVGPNTRVVDLGGRMAMPGLHDAHAHLLISGLQNTVECQLPLGVPLADVIAILKTCERGLTSGDWLVGGRVAHTQFPNNEPHRTALDTAFPDRPVFLADDSLHQAIVNSRALAVAGINKDTPDPPGGRLIKDAAGELTGMLIENASWLVRRHIPFSAGQDTEAARWAVGQYNRVGITSVQEASANHRTLSALHALEKAGRLSLEVAAHLVYGNQAFGWGSNEELQELIDRRATFRSDHVHPDFIKMWIDGSPLPPWFTSVEMDPSSGEIDPRNLFFQPAELKELVIRFDSQGLMSKLHVAGRGSAHVAIDAIAAARKSNPTSGLRHELGHSGTISPADMARMGEMAIVGEVSPIQWNLFETLGNPPSPAWQFRSLQKQHVLTTMGTDWVVTPTPNMFVGLQGMLQRGDESIALGAAIRTMTINGAVALGWDARQGSIETGKLANLIVLDRNLFEVPAEDIGATEVLLTIFQGEIVHTAAPFASAP